jgi:hypothetical protein
MLLWGPDRVDHISVTSRTSVLQTFASYTQTSSKIIVTIELLTAVRTLVQRCLTTNIQLSHTEIDYLIEILSNTSKFSKEIAAYGKLGIVDDILKYLRNLYVQENLEGSTEKLLYSFIKFKQVGLDDTTTTSLYLNYVCRSEDTFV